MSKENQYFIVRDGDKTTLVHGGKKGMKWGFNDGVANGKRKAQEIADKLGVDERDRVVDATVEFHKRPLSLKRAKAVYDANKEYRKTPLGKAEAFARNPKKSIKNSKVGKAVKSYNRKRKLVNAQIKVTHASQQAEKKAKKAIKKGKKWLKDKF